GGKTLGQSAAGGHPTVRAGQAMQPVLLDGRLDLGQVGDLMDQARQILAVQVVATTPAGTGLAIAGRPGFSGGTNGRNALGWPGCPRGFARRVGREACASVRWDRRRAAWTSWCSSG